MRGGAAFPGPSFTQGGHPNGHDMGMTLRDWFAGQLLSGLSLTSDADVEWMKQHGATNAYAIADAMLKARQ